MTTIPEDAPNRNIRMGIDQTAFLGRCFPTAAGKVLGAPKLRGSIHRSRDGAELMVEHGLEHRRCCKSSEWGLRNTDKGTHTFLFDVDEIRCAMNRHEGETSVR